MMTQIDEDHVVVRGLSARFKRRLRSAASTALTAGLAFSFVAATAFPLAPAHFAPKMATDASAIGGSAAGLATPISERPSRPPRPPATGPLTSVSTYKYSSENIARTVASGAAGSASPRAGVSVAFIGATPAEQLLRFRTRASRTRGQPVVG